MVKSKALIGLLALGFSSLTNAALISVDDSVFGIDAVTRDTVSGLEWLDLTFSVAANSGMVCIVLPRPSRRPTCTIHRQLQRNGLPGHLLVHTYGITR
jgi:hypothetical protein